MSDMTLREALQTDEVKQFLGLTIQEALSTALPAALAEALPAAVEAEIEQKLPALRESVREEIDRGNQLAAMHNDAVRLIEASPLRGAAKQSLLDDYALTESGDTPAPGRALALVEAVADADGKVTKSARLVLRETVEADIKRTRDMLRESAPTTPRATGGGEPAAPAAAQFGGEGSQWAEMAREQGMDPTTFGATPAPTTAT